MMPYQRCPAACAYVLKDIMTIGMTNTRLCYNYYETAETAETK